MKKGFPANARWTAVLLTVALLLAGGCASPKVREAQELAAAGNLDSARALLERERELRPDSAEVRAALGEVYYRIARNALDRGGDEDRYLDHLEKAVEEFVAAIELEPADSSPHLYLATMDLYRGDLEAALRGLENAHRLAPTGFAHTNLGEMYVYLGDTREARQWSLKGLRKGAGPGPVTFNRMLIEWREGDVIAAEREFETLWKRHPEMISTINMAPLPREPQSFEEFAGYCCASPGCGPHMGDACASLGLAVGERNLSEDAIRRELHIEFQKQRRLKEIYEQRKELEIEVEETESGDAPSDP